MFFSHASHFLLRDEEREQHRTQVTYPLAQNTRDKRWKGKRLALVCGCQLAEPLRRPLTGRRWRWRAIGNGRATTPLPLIGRLRWPRARVCKSPVGDTEAERGWSAVGTPITLLPVMYSIHYYWPDLSAREARRGARRREGLTPITKYSVLFIYYHYLSTPNSVRRAPYNWKELHLIPPLFLQ